MQSFGEHLRRWRGERGLSQLALAAKVETSTRHLSFLESGRSMPRRAMVMRLADALTLAPHERDRALESAGLPPDHRQAPPDGADREALERAVGTLLANHDPLPAYSMDGDWRLLGSNAGGERLLSVLGSPAPPSAPPSAPASAPISAPASAPISAPTDAPIDAPTDTPGTSGRSSLVELLIAHADTGSIVNWIEVTALALARAQAELSRRRDPPPDVLASIGRLAALHAERSAGQVDARTPTPDDTSARTGARDEATADIVTTKVAVPLRVRAGDVTLSLISMISQFGGIDYLDVDAPRVELMFPEDTITAEWFRSGTPDRAASRAPGSRDDAGTGGARAATGETGC